MDHAVARGAGHHLRRWPHDGLFELIGGKPAPAVAGAWASSACSICSINQDCASASAARRAYAVIPSGSAMVAATVVAEALRAEGLAVVCHAAGKDGLGSMKAQFKRADASGARFASSSANGTVPGQVAVKPCETHGHRSNCARSGRLARLAHELHNA